MQAIEAKEDLRKAHFKFGQAPPQETFVTTNQEKNILIEGYQGNETKKKVEMVDNIVYGTDKVIYKTIMKDTLVPHNLSG